MNVWEKTLINLDKGLRKFTAAAAVFSERIKAEVNIVRMRIRIDSVQARIDELHRLIGRRIVELKSKAALFKSCDQLLKDEEIAAALAELAERERELEDLNVELRSEQSFFKPSQKKSEDTAP